MKLQKYIKEMKTMNYGDMPSWGDFQKAFKKELKGKPYNYVLKGDDARTAGNVKGVPIRGDFSDRELWNIVLSLKKAWDNGLDRNYGVHYLEGMERDWIWNKEEMIDLRETPEYKYIKKLNYDCLNHTHRSKERSI